MRFLNIKTDYAFKKVFGSENSKNILKSFLNSTLELSFLVTTVSVVMHIQSTIITLVFIPTQERNANEISFF